MVERNRFGEIPHAEEAFSWLKLAISAALHTGTPEYKQPSSHMTLSPEQLDLQFPPLIQPHGPAYKAVAWRLRCATRVTGLLLITCVVAGRCKPELNAITAACRSANVNFFCHVPPQPDHAVWTRPGRPTTFPC
jgi:hypothetical protein